MAAELLDAAKNGDESRVRSLLASGADPNVQGIGGLTALHHVADSRAGCVNCAEALVAAGADPNAASAAVFDEPTKPALADGAEVLVPASAVASPGGFSGESYALQFKKADGQELSEFSSRCSAYSPRSADWRQSAQGTLNAKTLFDEAGTKAVSSFCKVGGKELGFLVVLKTKPDGSTQATTLTQIGRADLGAKEARFLASLTK